MLRVSSVIALSSVIRVSTVCDQSEQGLVELVNDEANHGSQLFRRKLWIALDTATRD